MTAYLLIMGAYLLRPTLLVPSTPERPVPHKQRYYLPVFSTCDLLLESFSIHFAQTKTHTQKEIVYAQGLVIFMKHTHAHIFYSALHLSVINAHLSDTAAKLFCPCNATSSLVEEFQNRLSQLRCVLRWRNENSISSRHRLFLFSNLWY